MVQVMLMLVLQTGMQNDILTCLRRLSDGELVTRLKGLVARDRELTAQIVAHLAELDTRDVFLREGYSSLFVYCRDALGLSESEAYNRIEVARAARRFPVVLDMLASGSINLTSVRLLAPRLTESNHREVLESARGKTKPEVEQIVARLSPRPDVRASVRRLPTAPSASGVLATPLLPSATLSAASASSSDTAAYPVAHPLPSGPPAVMSLSPDRYKFQLTIGGETLEKLRLAKDMLGHAIPSGDDAAVLDRALTALLASLAKKKFADTRQPRPSGGTKAAACDPPAKVKRAVWLRDLGRCAFIGTNGHRCNERRFLEFHHVDPRALGGEASVDLIQLRCRRHNDYEGRLYFGKRRRDVKLVSEKAATYLSRPTAAPELVLERVGSGARHIRPKSPRPDVRYAIRRRRDTIPQSCDPISIRGRP
jgi:Domain of unknown function (DUF222)